MTLNTTKMCKWPKMRAKQLCSNNLDMVPNTPIPHRPRIPRIATN